MSDVSNPKGKSAAHRSFSKKKNPAIDRLNTRQHGEASLAAEEKDTCCGKCGSHDHTTKQHKKNIIDEAKVDAGKSPETKEKDRNVRRFGVSHNVSGHGKLRRALHRSDRGDKKKKGDKSQYVETESVDLATEARNTKADGNSLRSVSTPAMQGKKGNVNSKGRSVTGGASMGGMNIRGAGGLGKSKPKNVELVVGKYKKQVSSDRKAAAKERAGMRSKGLKYESFLDFVKEEGYDKMRDDRLVKYGIGHDGSDKKPSKRTPDNKKIKGKTVLQKETEKKYGKGKSALDIVKAKITAKHGKGAIMKNEEVISEISADTLSAASRAADKDRGKKAVAGDKAGAAKRVKQASKFYKAAASKRKEEAKEEYTVTNADKKGNTPAWKGYKSGKKNAKTGKPLYKAADHVKEDAPLKSFREFVAEGNPTSRMIKKSNSQQTGNISADRGTDAKKNKESRKGLEKDLKKKGIGYKKGVGEYKYDSGEKGREVSYQTSPAKGMSKRRFGKTMRRLGRKHGQESVITKDKGKPARLHDTESKKPGKSVNVGKTKAGKHPKGSGETSGTKVRSGKLSSKTNKPSYHYG